MKFGDKLSQLRRKNGLSQEELGYKLNVTRQTISKWELGQSKPDTDKLIEISKLLNVDFNQLVDDGAILEDNTSDLNEMSDDVRPRKWLLILLIVIAIGIVIFLANGYIDNRKAKTEAAKDGIFNFFNIFTELEDSITNDDFDKKQFNSTFEFRVGTEYSNSVSSLIDEIVTNNKTNPEHIISVIFNDINTSAPNEIKNIKKNLGTAFDQYEVSADYDENGYINKITIEEITYEENEENSDENIVDSYEISRFNNILEIYAGTKFGHQVEVLLDRVITSNKTNSERIIRVIYNGTNTVLENEIRNIKKSLDDWSEYEVIFDYDEVGYITQVTITN